MTPTLLIRGLSCIAAAVLVTACGNSSKSPAAPAIPASAGAAASAGASAPADASAPSAGQSPASAAAASGKTPDPCSLLTAAEVSAATGSTVGDGKETDGPPPLGGKTCNWSSTGGVHVVDYEIAIKSDADITAPGETASSLFSQTTTTFPGLTAVSGIGDKASFGKSMGYVLSKGLFLATVADIGGTADNSAVNEKLATMAVSKLP